MERLVKYVLRLATILFLAGGFLGIYSRWQHHESDNGFVIFGVVASLFFLSAFVLRWFEHQKLANAIVNLWIGIIFNVLTFTSVGYDYMFDSAQDFDVVDMLLIGSTCIYCCGTLLDRIHNYGNVEFHLLTIKEVLLLVGFAFGSVVSEHGSPMLLLAIAVACSLIAIHLKSALSLINAVMTGVVVAMKFFPAIKVQYNPFCLSTFAIWLSFEAIIDMHFSKYSTVDRWKGILTCGKRRQESLLVLIFLGECIYCIYAIQITFNHHRGVAKVAMVFVFLLWLAGHITFFMDCWVFVRKVEECLRSLRKEIDTNEMLDALAFRGVRHFCLVSKSIIVFTIATTTLPALLLWKVSNLWFISLFLIVIPVEVMVYSVLSSLGKCLGGTAIGYAMVIPCHNSRKVGLVALSEPEFQSANRVAVELINLLSRFFSEHVVHNFGTELCTSGLTIQSFESKLESFFNQRVSPGLAYDTFVLYYSGPVHDNGDWALLEGKAFSLSQLLTLWEKMNGETGARLILVLDTKSSYKWISEVKKTKHFVGLQVGMANKSEDVEAASSHTVGELTKHWVHFNSTIDPDKVNELNSPPTDLKVCATFAVSGRWFNFKFHIPTQKDVSQHIDNSFPTFVQPIARVFNKFPQMTGLFCFCEECVATFRNLIMTCLPPLTLDTGHGFKLIRTMNKM